MTAPGQKNDCSKDSYVNKHSKNPVTTHNLSLTIIAASFQGRRNKFRMSWNLKGLLRWLCRMNVCETVFFLLVPFIDHLSSTGLDVGQREWIQCFVRQRKGSNELVKKGETFVILPADKGRPPAALGPSGMNMPDRTNKAKALQNDTDTYRLIKKDQGKIDRKPEKLQELQRIKRKEYWKMLTQDPGIALLYELPKLPFHCVFDCRVQVVRFDYAPIGMLPTGFFREMDALEISAGGLSRKTQFNEANGTSTAQVSHKPANTPRKKLSNPKGRLDTASYTRFSEDIVTNTTWDNQEESSPPEYININSQPKGVDNHHSSPRTMLNLDTNSTGASFIYWFMREQRKNVNSWKHGTPLKKPSTYTSESTQRRTSSNEQTITLNQTEVRKLPKVEKAITTNRIQGMVAPAQQKPGTGQSKTDLKHTKTTIQSIIGIRGIQITTQRKS
ncbi:hypothetical protein CLF_103487 [Clonorchis sinensis]|uniref:Uncharacterized protein n=1 Tax=Clonorchis sinensis TaxID=79923 RepID=G7Y9U2_CLOSI|nr:hypothetical protein CLF_103487 [Clonorchis sinensis]